MGLRGIDWTSFFFPPSWLACLSSTNYLNLLGICLPFEALSSFGVVEWREMTSLIWYPKSEPISTILVDLFCDRIMTEILTWMDTLRINLAECLVSKSDLLFSSVGRRHEVRCGTWTAARHLGKGGNLVHSCQRQSCSCLPFELSCQPVKFSSLSIFFFCWNYSLDLLSPLIWLKNNFFSSSLATGWSGLVFAIFKFFPEFNSSDNLKE